jgi:hypothetical protein
MLDKFGSYRQTGGLATHFLAGSTTTASSLATFSDESRRRRAI